MSYTDYVAQSAYEDFESLVMIDENLALKILAQNELDSLIEVIY